MNTMEEKTLIEALDLLDQGLSADEIVARYPAAATDLRPFLQTAAALATLATQPTAAAQARSRADFLATAEASAAAPARRAPTLGWLTRRLVMPLLAVFVTVFMGGTLLAGASGSAVPGSALYAAKRGIEEVRLNLAPDPERAAALREAFRQERIHEIESLLASGDAAQVEMSGAIETMDGDRWQVAGLPVALTGGTLIDGAPAVGAVVRVEGQTTAGVVIADRITVLSAAPTPGPATTPESTPAAVDEGGTPGNAPAGRPEATLTPTPTSPRPPATPSPEPGLTATPGPSATPDDDDDGDDDDPTDAPDDDPTDAPDNDPTDEPDVDPTDAPDDDPTDAPDVDPTDDPADDD